MANKKLSELTELKSPLVADEQYIVDKSDFTDGVDGTSKRITLQNVFDYSESLTQTLTNKTIDGNNNTISNIVLGAEVTGASTALTDTANLTYNADSDVSGNAWVLDEDTMSSNSDIKVPTQQSVKAYIDGGWSASTDTWTYASASTFTISGVDRTSVLTKGTKLKFTQTTVKYAVVVNSSFATDTTITIAVNDDYTVANAAITLPNFSYQENPAGFPEWFNFTTTWSGFSVDPTGTWRYNISGKKCFMEYKNNVGGTSNSTALSFTTPVASKTARACLAVTFYKDNGSNASTVGHLMSSAGSSTVSAYKSFFQVVWTASSGKDIYPPTFCFEWN